MFLGSQYHVNTLIVRMSNYLIKMWKFADLSQTIKTCKQIAIIFPTGVFTALFGICGSLQHMPRFMAAVRACVQCV